MIKYRYAGFWIRFLADVIDTIILTIVTSAISYCLVGVAGWSGYPADSNSVLIQAFEFFLYVALAIPYFVTWQLRDGATPGKKLFKIRIYDRATLGRISRRQAWIRFLGYGVSYLPIVLGYVLAAIHPEKRALHDLLAGTVVLRRSEEKK